MLGAVNLITFHRQEAWSFTDITKWHAFCSLVVHVKYRMAENVHPKTGKTMRISLNKSGLLRQMSEDLAKQLASYKAQLQQVEAALSGNGENEDLLKLKKDLQEVIELTKDLLSTQPSETLASSDNFASTQPTHSWKVGDKCMAIWSEDGQCYEAEIEEIDEENGTAAITFAGYGNAEVTPLLNLKPVEEGRKAKEDSGNKPMSKKEMIAQQREYKKKKALKKAQRIKELEQEREDQKVKRSIFASPESVTGKVGVGTCGIADKPMTQYQDTSKYNVRHLMPQ
ncbi:hypothetical protein E5288_WYG015531 [Bos mutus]|nr:hypothetical protein [Bos mutus]